jgi:hypothetical protein
VSLPTTLEGLRELLGELDARERKALLGGVIATQVYLAASDAQDGVAGDVVCVGQGGPVPPTAPTVKRALTASLASAGQVLGVLLDPIPRGGAGYCAILGVLPPSLTGLAAGSPSIVRVNVTTGRCESVGSLGGSDYAVGRKDSDGNLTLYTTNSTAPGGGFVQGPGSCTDGVFPLFDGTSGTLLKNSTTSPASITAAIAAAQAAAQAYADSLKLNGDPKAEVVTVATSNITLSGLAQTISGVAVNQDGNRVGTVGQTDPKENGIWVAHSGAWTRPTDFAAASSASGAFFAVIGGTKASSLYLCTSSPGSDVVGTNNLTFAQMGGTISMGGDCSGTTASCTVSKINGTTVTSAGGALVTGAVLRATGASTCDYGTVDLANTNAVSGILAAANVDRTSGAREIAAATTLTFSTGAGTADVTAYTVPASPSGTKRFKLYLMIVRLTVAITGGGTVVIRAGTTTGGNDLLVDSATWNSGTAVGTEVGVAIADLGTAFTAAKGYIAELDASATAKARATTAGGGISGGAAAVYVYGALETS